MHLLQFGARRRLVLVLVTRLSGLCNTSNQRLAQAHGPSCCLPYLDTHIEVFTVTVILLTWST